MPNNEQTPSGMAHGAQQLPSVIVESYNVELRDQDGFIGDRASFRAFRSMLEEWREKLRQIGDDDPLGEAASGDISKKKLDKLLLEGDPKAAGVVQSAIEEFADELATVVKRFIRLKGWKEAERIAVGGGLRESRIGELAIGRAMVILKAAEVDIDLVPIRHHPDQAGLLGAAHLAPSWMFKGHDSLLAVDIGGTNIRAGVVTPNLKKAADLSRAEVWKLTLWRHRDEDPPPSREEALERLAAMLQELIGKAESADFKLAPFIGVGCPGKIESDGAIAKGGQNLPGNWESSRFNLPRSLLEAIPRIGDHETMVVMHNDAVIQGLSQVPFMQDVSHWGVLTIGTGLGNACYSNRNSEPAKAAKS
jgi:predicted NBD/HSP70 family sugar kinase